MGLLTFSDYGIAWDESAQRVIGGVSALYVVYGDQTIDTFHNADYGVGVELPLFLMEKIMGLEESDQIFNMRHLVNHLFFLACLYCGFWLIYNIFGNIWLAIIGVLLFVLNPQIYAHSFFNTKDIPFMSMYLVCFLFIYKGFRQYRYQYFLLAGAAIGFLINLRIMGVMLLAMVLFFLVVDIIALRNDKVRQLKVWRCMALFLLAFWGVLYFSWPYLYEHPIEKLGMVFSNMSKFRWHGSVLYLGEVIKGSELPWHYAIVWFGISNPIVYVTLGISGIALAALRLIRKPLRVLENSLDRHLVIYLVCLIAPVLAVIVLNSVIYDGWRHLYFIYPPFVLILIYGIYRIRLDKYRRGLYVALSVAFIATGSYMIWNHPHNNLFFNILVNRSEYNHERSLFEMDYWGTTYRKGLEEIVRRDSSAQIRVQSWKPPGSYNLKILPKEDRERILITDDNPKYFITAYRFHPEDFQYDQSQEIFKISVQNNTVLSVFELED